MRNVPLSVDEIENAVEEIEQELYRQGKQEVQSSVIGELVMERLRQMDKIAYIRFASVYRSFNDVETMLEELQDLLYRKKAEPSGHIQGLGLRDRQRSIGKESCAFQTLRCLFA